MKIAVSIPVKSLKIALKLISKANRKADFIELRLDYSRHLAENELQKLVMACRKPVIATVRSKKEGGFFSGKLNEKIALLEKAVELGVQFVDVEFGCGKSAVREILKKKGLAKLILSYHNFKKTPSFSELKKLLEKMLVLKPDVVKIACFAKTEKDNDAMILLMEEAKKLDVEIIAFCMGKMGKYSRLHSCDFGAFLTFASLEKGMETACGQLTVSELKSYIEEFA